MSWRGQSSNFFQHTVCSIDGNVRSYRAQNLLIGSIIALVLLSLMGAMGLQKAFMRIGEYQKVLQAMDNPNQYFTNTQNSGFSSLWGGKSEDALRRERNIQFMNGLTAHIVTIITAFLFLLLCIRLSSAKSNSTDSINVLGVCSAPLILAMLVSAILISFADGFGKDSSIPSYLYLISMFVASLAMLTSYIILYVNVESVLKISARARYWTTVGTTFVVLGMFGWITNWLASENPWAKVF